MIRYSIAFTMSFSPRVILSAASRERCVVNIKELPAIVHYKVKPTKYASVLIPLCTVNDEVCVLYTVRSLNLKNHRGQTSFPGGMIEENESAIAAALRETEEEIGIPPDNVDVWGVMPPFQGRDKEMLITPVIGEVKNFSMDKLVPNVNEVDEIFTVPMSVLCDPANHAHLSYKPPLPVYMYGKYRVWGITGLITHMFLLSLLSDDVYKVDFMRKKFTLQELMPAKL